MVLRRTSETAAQVRRENDEVAEKPDLGGGSAGAGLLMRIAVMQIRQTQQMGSMFQRMRMFIIMVACAALIGKVRAHYTSRFFRIGERHIQVQRLTNRKPAPLQAACIGRQVTSES